MKAIGLPSVTVALVPAALLFAGAGCGAMKAVGNYAMSPTETVPGAPKTLDASPEETGILLVHAELRGKNIIQKYSYELMAASVIGLEDPGTIIRVRPFSDNLVVFQGLEPGQYTLVRLSGSRNTGNGWEHAQVPLAPEPSLSVTVEAGEITYLGKLTCWTGKDQRTEWDNGPDSEKAAWRALSDKYGDSPWGSRIAAHLDER